MSRFSPMQVQYSMGDIDDIFDENSGFIFIIQHMETKRYISSNPVPEEVTYFMQEYTDDPKKAMSFKARGSAIAYCINHNIILTHDVINHCE